MHLLISFIVNYGNFLSMLNLLNCKQQVLGLGFLLLFFFNTFPNI